MNPKPNTDNPYNVSYENFMDTDANTECTGLIYRAAENGEEWDAYQEIFDFATHRYPESSSPANKQPRKFQDR